MKYCIHAAIAMLVCLSSKAQPVKLSGQLLAEQTSDVTFISNIDGFRSKLTPDPSGTFSFISNNIGKGFYSMGDVFEVYLEPGFDLTIRVAPDSTYIFSGKGSEENNVYLALRKQITKYLPSSPYQFYTVVSDLDVKDFLSQVDLYKKDAYQRIGIISNTGFKTLLKEDFDFYVRTRVMEYQYTYGVDSIKQQNFFRLIESRNYTNASLDSANKAMYNRQLTNEENGIIDSALFSGWSMENELLYKNSSAYRKVIDSRISNEAYSDLNKEVTEEGRRAFVFQYISDHISNSFVRDYLLYTSAKHLLGSSMNTWKEKEVGYKKYISLKNLNPVYKKEIEEVYNNYTIFADKKPSPGFIYRDIDGKEVSLAQLRGKYVYIDVWATWCGPCKAEIPFLTKIEEEYKNRNIHFVSMSVDNPSDHRKWKDYVTKNKLQGIQLMADKAFESEFVKKFNINGIPRFILIDPKGNIVSAEAKRPSDPELKQQLDSLL